ncbi:uncharacterized protein N7477_008807 [Penicillium maclennaniae]|uniref:uncharacterized protein n=1 Tax=Penicillium maclennaniae TaxID=1343394 RepID=UPI0025414AF7|nr:uncharacterized protein N7477_008807 [Penicillium maclennaniae]KAJ5666359.1 hypothetical protein N7477_008807 [Penicillium maclennaniae]
MPPLSAYTPFESLLFFQSLATSDVRPASFATISNSLRNNPLVRQNVAFSADRLTAEALEDLYATLLRDGFDRDALTGPNGRPTESPGASNPKKRKIASPRPEGLTDGVTHAVLIPELVSHLYARYRELVTKEIRDDEKRYTAIKDEIEHLKKEGNKPLGTGVKDAVKLGDDLEADPMDVDVKEETSRQEHPDTAVPPVQSPQARKPPGDTSGQYQAKQQQVPAPTQPLSYDTQPQPQPQPRAVNGEIFTQTTDAPSIVPQAHQTAPTTPAAARAPHPSQIAPRPNVPGTTPVAGKPGIPSGSGQPTPTQSSFQQWQLAPSPQSPYSAISTAIPAQSTPVVTKQPPPGPIQLPPQRIPIPSHVPSTPGALPTGAQSPVPVGNSRISHTPSVVIPPYTDRGASRPRLSIDTPGSSTPWKMTPRASVADSPVSPARPGPGDVSPISDRAPSPDDMDESTSRERKSRRGQPEGKAGSQYQDRETFHSPDTCGKYCLITEPRAFCDPTGNVSGCGGRRKGAAVDADDQALKGRSKRKRGTSEALEPESTPMEGPRVDTRYVMCTRGFHRTAAPILNDVTTHKLASIFAKPIGERDAPGYHDLIYRPQDLKSIKSAVHQGSKAVVAATEAVSTPAGDGESPAPAVGTPSKHNALMLPKTEDLVPPKGIVNSAQLEKEFIRMFANAIMYNPAAERGFGPAFPMISDRGTRESTQSEGDEGGIIQDSLEMFEDVEQAVKRWRAAERTADELANKNVLSLRRGSASDFVSDSADDAKG